MNSNSTFILTTAAIGLLMSTFTFFPRPLVFGQDEVVASSAAEKTVLLDAGKCQVHNRADILLITSAELADSWKELAIWKTKTGRPTKIITITEIKEAFKGKDIQDKIRQCCLEHIANQQTRWVILGGDSRGRKGGHVPDRDTHHVEFYKYKNIPTDIYYLSEADWDANDDGVYGKFSDDIDAVDYVNPNASIGRIPVSTPAEVAAYTEKIIHYESLYPIGDFAKQMIYTCAEKHANPKLHTSKKVVKASWEASEIQQFFVNKTPWDVEDEGDYDLTAENWLTLFNDKQASKLHMHGHGLNNLWALENRSTVTAETVDKLSNEFAYPVMTTVSCFTGQFDSLRDPCITESMLRKKSAGAIAIIAPSREGIPVFHKRSDFQLMMTEGKMDGTTETLTKFWQHALKGNITLGDAFRAARQDMTTDARRTDGYHFVQCELNLLGDPTLDARAQPVSALQCMAKIDGTTIRVNGAEECNVCIWDGAEIYEIKKASKNGTVEFDVPVGQGENVDVSVFGSNKNTWSTQINLSK